MLHDEENMNVKRAPLAGLSSLFLLFFTALLPPLSAEVHESPELSSSEPAIVTFVSNPEQERSVRALIQSVRALGGPYAQIPVYVVSTDTKTLPCHSLKDPDTIILPLEMNPEFLNYPLAFKAFAAATVEKRVHQERDTLIFLDPGVLVLKPLSDLVLDKEHDLALRPVTLSNGIGIPPEAGENDYWTPIYRQCGLDARSLPTVKTIVEEIPLLPYYNCEVFSFRPALGLARQWAETLTVFLRDDAYQKTVCTTFTRQLFLHQAVLSAVVGSGVTNRRIRALPLESAYPFSQHDRLPKNRQAASLDDLSVVIFDRTWQQNPGWMKKLPLSGPLKERLFKISLDYLEVAPRIYRLEGSCNAYLALTPKGSVLIDPAGASVAAEFFRSLMKTHPLKAILLTHGHQDHSGDIGLWREGRDIPVIAQRELKRYFAYLDEMKGFFARRNAIWSGKLPPEGPNEVQDIPQEMPNRYFADETEFVSEGVHFRLIHTPGETPDQTTIWIPELKAVFVGDNYYEYFINNATFRGTMIRPVLGYIRAMERALSLKPEYFLMGHGAPLIGSEEIQRVAGRFLQALKYVYSETLKGINEGKDVHTLMKEISLPREFGIGEYYGKTAWTVRGIWQEYVGWFDENPASMYAEPFSDIHADLLELAGEQKLIERAQGYLDKGAFQKVLHLTGLIIGVVPRHEAANRLRRSALQALRKGTHNYIERIWLDHGIRLCERNLAPQIRPPKSPID